MIQSAETRRTLHTHTHTHTHTGKLLPSIKQIVPICFMLGNNLPVCVCVCVCVCRKPRLSAC